MKKLLLLCLVFVLIVSCDGENAFDCFQTTGTIVTQEFEVSNFDRILVNRDVELIVSEGPNFEVIIETGDNLLNDVEVSVVDGLLELTDNNTCNFVRDFGVTRAFVTAPNITEIRNSSQFQVSSDGILNYQDLRLISEDFNNSDFLTSGDFRLQINSNQVTVISNGTSFFFIEGTVDNIRISFAAGVSRFEGENLIAQEVDVFNRSSNDMIVNPQQSLTGVITSTGNVVSFNTPPNVDVEERFSGRLIFED